MSCEEGLVMSEEYIKDITKDNIFKVVIPAEDELQIDLDSEEDHKRYNHAAEIFFRYIAPVDIKTATSSSGEGRCHITIKLPFKASLWQRLALQAALGSDHIREILSCIQLLEGDNNPILFKERV